MSFQSKMFHVFEIFFFLVWCFFEALIHLFKPPGKKSITGEIVLVTGAGHGIGKQIALEVSKEGAIVVVWDIHQENNDKTAQEINESGGKAFAYVCDVTNSADIATAAQKVRADVGEVSILVNNAGVLNGGYLMDLDEKAIQRTFNVNILSHFWMVREFLPHMMTKDHGHIFNVASLAGLQGSPVLTDYCASKSAVVSFGQSLSLELEQLGHTGIKVSTLCPYVVDTGMLINYESSLLVTLTTEEVVKMALDGLQRNYSLITVPSHSWLFYTFISLLPVKARTFAYKFGLMKIQPQYKKEQ